MTQVEKWDVFELALQGRQERNPFTDYEIHGIFYHKKETLTVNGFYDGNGIYRIRFMPSYEGEYTYEVSGSFSPETFSGRFTAIPPSKNSHGPVRAANRFYLEHQDGTPHHSCGTTCYAFALQETEIIEQTFQELEKGYFNKMRFCLMPKHYDFCLQDPPVFPYEGIPMDASFLTRENFNDYNGAAPGNHWNFERFNPAFFRRYDNIIRRLMELGIEADLILFHAYDRWGFSTMSMEENLLYLRYVAARYGAFRNVWWALANEYELLRHLTTDDWEQLGTALQAADPYRHLISIHNCEAFFDYKRPWITHCSCQREDHHKTTEYTDELRNRFGKPVIWDEVGYEGNFPHCWGNFTPEELVRRAWESLIRGGYCGHSETILSDDNIIWWAHGGKLKGESAKRFGFMLDFMKDVPGGGLCLGSLRDDIHFQWDDDVAIPADPAFNGQYYFFYFSIWRPSFRQIWIDDTTWFDVEIIDTWNMTINRCGRYRGRFELPLPGRQYIGIRLKRSIS